MIDNGELHQATVLPVDPAFLLIARAQEALSMVHSLTGNVELDDPEKIGEIVTSLGYAATYLARSSRLVGELSTDAQAIILGNTVSLELKLVDEGQSIPQRLLPHLSDTPEVSPQELVDPAELVVDKVGEVVAEVAPLDGAMEELDTTNGIVLDYTLTKQANDRAIAKFGDSVRKVVLLDDQVLDIDGRRITLFGKTSTHAHSAGRLKMLNHLFSTRDKITSSHALVEASGISNISTSFSSLLGRLVDNEGNSILALNKLNLRRSTYAMAPDIVVEDRRSSLGSLPLEPANHVSESSNNIDSATLPSTEVVASLDPKELRRSLISIKSFEAANDAQRQRIIDEKLKPIRIALKNGNRIQINDHESAIRGQQLELLNHLLINIGKSLSVTRLWRAGYSLVTGLPKPEETPSRAKLDELFGMLSTDAETLNRKFGPFITINRSTKTFGILDGFYAHDAREFV